jgi:2-polyprenyl-3-methyl-5-hydroxy-6-metoxy-1,4-benzoquinol methylase
MGGLPPYVRVESRWLDGEPFMPPEHAMTCDRVGCHLIRLVAMKRNGVALEENWYWPLFEAIGLFQCGGCENNMRRFPINRLCPLSGEPHSKIFAYVPVSAVSADLTYKPDFLDILGLQPDDEFPIVQSKSGFVFAGWRLPDDFIRKSESDAIDHSKTVTETVRSRRDNLAFVEAALKMIEQVGLDTRVPLRLLDYGCGYGFMLRLLQSRDIKCHGFDLSPTQRSIAAEKSGATIHSSIEEITAGGPYDLFICTEVLEHLPDPRQTLRFFKSVAKPGALLFVTVPNITPEYLEVSMADFAATGNFPLVFNPILHLNHFSDRTLREMLESEGLTVLYDFGRTLPPRDATSIFGDEPPKNVLLNAARVAKRAWVAPSSTHLFCRL